jgi:RHS repeat-associated protein
VSTFSRYDLRARLYGPGNGRFLTQDSFAGFSMDPASLHKYAFNHNDPVNRIDPSGHISMPELWANFQTFAITTAFRAAAWSARHPFLSAAAGLVANSMLPREFQVPTPMNFAPSAMGATASSMAQSGKHLVMTMSAFTRRAGGIAGGAFETFIATALRIPKNTQPYYVDLSWRLGAKFVPDFLWKGGFLETKAVRALRTHDIEQAEKLAAYAAEHGVPLMYLFLKKPSDNDLRRLRDAIADGSQGADINFSWNYIFD